MLWRNLEFSPQQWRAVEQLQSKGVLYLDAERGQFVAREIGHIESAFVFVGDSVNCRNCFLWNKIMFRIFNHLPEFCRLHCHKCRFFGYICSKRRDISSL